ncbi:MAG TPA: hypothetical protein VLT88_12280 [Desulfosarcina sp.]|nr:hypothetical protein [Desulfosarcina sp.]
MKNDFVDDLITAVTRVVTPNAPLLKEVLVIGGMPEPTQNLRYLSYNRHTTMAHGRSSEFSAVAVINNRRALAWQLSGYSKKISRLVFSSRWTRNPLDLFLNNLRCNSDVMAVLADADNHYTLLGILTTTDFDGVGLSHKHAQYICPVVALPGIDGRRLGIIQAFETANQIKQAGLVGVQFYRKTGRQMAGT